MMTQQTDRTEGQASVDGEKQRDRIIVMAGLAITLGLIVAATVYSSAPSELAKTYVGYIGTAAASCIGLYALWDLYKYHHK